MRERSISHGGDPIGKLVLIERPVQPPSWDIDLLGRMKCTWPMA